MSAGFKGDVRGVNHSITLPLAPNDVHLWLIREEDIAPERLLEWRTLLSSDEVVRLERFRFPKDQNLYLLAHAHLRRVLSKYAPVAPTDWQFRATALGRPEIALEPYCADLHFSLSHTPGLVAVAVSRSAEVGVDVEIVNRKMDVRELAEHSFAASENEHLEALAEPERRRRFLEIWTLKEAYAKARGLGMSLSFDQFAFDVREEETSLRFDKTVEEGSSAPPWQFYLERPTANHQLALAVRRVSGEDSGRMRIVTNFERVSSSPEK
jgi:4'-phosphopantetheinyl transferase